MCCTKGELVQIRRASKSWSSVLQYFELWRAFGRLECMSGKPMLCRTGPVIPKRCKRQRLRREPCSMCCTKGKLFQIRRASKSWSSVLQYFELWRAFGKLECMSGKPMLCRTGPVIPKRCKRHSGKHLPSWFAHAMRCSCGCVLAFYYFRLKSSFAWLCIFGLNCFLAVRSDIIECNWRIAI